MDQFWISLLGQSPAAAAVIFITLRFLTFLQEDRIARERTDSLKTNAIQSMTTEITRTIMVLERVESHLETVAHTGASNGK